MLCCNQQFPLKGEAASEVYVGDFFVICLFYFATDTFMWKMLLPFRKHCREIVNMSYQIRVFCQRLMGLVTFLFQKRPEVDTMTVYSAKTFHQVSRPLTATASHHNYFMTTRYFVPCYFQLMFTEMLLRETDETACQVFKCSLKIVLR